MEVAIIFYLKIEIKLSEKYINPQTELFRRISATHQCGQGMYSRDEFVTYWGGARTQDLSDLRQTHYPVGQEFA